jgi:hypothetical protein
MFGLIESPFGEPSDRNIYVFLTRDEILGLNSHKLSGKLAGIETEFSEYPFELEVKKKPKCDVQALEIKNSDDAYYLALDSQTYPDLLKNTFLGGRFGNFFKYDIAAVEYAKNDAELSKYLKLAERRLNLAEEL